MNDQEEPNIILALTAQEALSLNACINIGIERVQSGIKISKQDLAILKGLVKKWSIVLHENDLCQDPKCVHKKGVTV